MKRAFTAIIMYEGALVVDQCLDVDLANQRESEEVALFNLREAIALNTTPLVPTSRIV